MLNRTDTPETAEARRNSALAALPKPGAFIGGEWRHVLGGGTLEHVDPATGDVTQSFPVAGPQDVDHAVAAAERGLAEWRALTALQRAKAIRALGDLIRDHADELAALTTLETGTPISLTRARMATTPPSWFEYYAGWCDKLTGDTIPQVDPTHIQYTVPEPVGVVAKLVTWNSPMGGIQMSVPAALAAGCSVVIRPPELAPFTITRFIQLAQSVGLPDGVLNLLPAGPSGAEALVRHPSVAKISFTGGPEVARRIQSAAAESLTPLVLELGGKSANIIFPDADLARAIGHASMICALSGQGCSLPSRLLVHEDVFDEVNAGMLRALTSVPVGDPFEQTSMMGPLVSQQAMERVLGMIERAVADGASLACGGGRATVGDGRGFYVEPTLLVGVDNSSEIAQREVFGPVLCLSRFSSEEEAVELANDTAYGLAAYVHTKDLDRAMRLSNRLVSGNVSINGGPSPSGPHAPYGGVKSSGYGREGGREGILEFVSLKTVSVTI